MADRKTLDELTLMDDYMFAQVMRETGHLNPEALQEATAGNWMKL